MITRLTGTRSAMERGLRGICRCDGWKDVAALAALMAVGGALVLRMTGGPGAPVHHPRDEHRGVVAALVLRR